MPAPWSHTQVLLLVIYLGVGLLVCGVCKYSVLWDNECQIFSHFPTVSKNSTYSSIFGIFTLNFCESSGDKRYISFNFFIFMGWKSHLYPKPFKLLLPFYIKSLQPDLTLLCLGFHWEKAIYLCDSFC